jgi:hypothetical protein
MSPSSRLTRIALNTVAISGGEVANKASTFLVYAAVSRASGLESWGARGGGRTVLFY